MTTPDLHAREGKGAPTLGPSPRQRLCGDAAPAICGYFTNLNSHFDCGNWEMAQKKMENYSHAENVGEMEWPEVDPELDRSLAAAVAAWLRDNGWEAESDGR